MSYTTLFKVPESGPVEAKVEYKNSFLSACYVWEKLRERYLPNGPEHPEKAWKLVWKLFKRADILFEYRAVLAATFDYVMVKREDLPALADAMEQFARDFGGESHLPRMAADLRELADDETCFAVCWQQTSVSADMWWDSENDQPYDVSKGDKHWFLFEEVKDE